MSEFMDFCRTPVSEIKKWATTVPIYAFTGLDAAGKLLGADLDSNGQVDFVSYRDRKTLAAYEQIPGAGAVQNGLWRKVGTMTGSELVQLRDECGAVSGGVTMGGGGLMVAGAVLFFYGGAIGASSFVLVGGLATLAVGVAVLVVSEAYHRYRSDIVTDQIKTAMQHVHR